MKTNWGKLLATEAFRVGINVTEAESEEAF